MLLSCCACRSQHNVARHRAIAEVTVASFNMRCQVPEDNPSNNWHYRRHRIAEFIAARQIDVVASQELVGTQDSSLLSLMPAYGEVRASDGVNAIFYRRDAVEVISKAALPFPTRPK